MSYKRGEVYTVREVADKLGCSYNDIHYATKYGIVTPLGSEHTKLYNEEDIATLAEYFKGCKAKDARNKQQNSVEAFNKKARGNNIDPLEAFNKKRNDETQQAKLAAELAQIAKLSAENTALRLALTKAAERKRAERAERAEQNKKK